MPEPRKLRVFLSCGIHDKPTVHVLYRRLKGEGWITPWLDDEDLLPGQDLELEIENELEAVDIALVCVSKQSLNEEGYFQKEIDSIAEAARKKPKDTVFIIPILLDYCELPRSLRPWLPVDFYPNEDRDTAYQLILKSLEVKHGFVTGKTAKSPSKYWVSTIESKVIDDLDDLTFGGFTFVKIPKGKFKMGSRVSNDLARKDEYPQRRYYIPYNYWITRFPISNDQFSEYEVTTGHTDSLPKDWKRRLGQPVVNVSWHEVVEYTKWLNIIFKKEIPDGLVFRLPTEAEWERASRGEDGAEFPWGNANLDEFLNGGSPELMARLMRKIEFDEGKSSNNFAEFNASFSRKNSSGIENDSEKAALDWMKMKLAELRTSMELADVGIFSPVTDSTHDIADMMGAVWEWTQSLYKLYPYETNDGRENLEASGERVIRGYFSPNNERFTVRSAKRVCAPPDVKGKYLGFRIVIAPPVS